MSSRSQCLASGLVLAALVVFLATLTPALGQVGAYEYVRVFGRVQWLGGQTMVIVTDCLLLEVPCNPVTVRVDLRRLSPGDTRGIRAGTFVLVDGYVWHDDGRHRVMATSITVAEWQAP